MTQFNQSLHFRIHTHLNRPTVDIQKQNCLEEDPNTGKKFETRTALKNYFNHNNQITQKKT